MPTRFLTLIGHWVACLTLVLDRVRFAAWLTQPSAYHDKCSECGLGACMSCSMAQMPWQVERQNRVHASTLTTTCTLRSCDKLCSTPLTNGCRTT
jgi:hypothetical protein